MRSSQPELSMINPHAAGGRVATALRSAAQTLVQSHSAFGAFYRSMQARLGAPKANMATAHKLARIFYPCRLQAIRLWTQAWKLMSSSIKNECLR